MKALMVATAPPFCVNVGRITEHAGRLFADEFAWLSQDQIGLVEFRVEGIEIGERETSFRIDYTGQRLSHRIAGLVMPESEVVDLDSANAYQDSQDFKVGGLERQRGIKACPTLLDERKVKPSRVCNGLHAGSLAESPGVRVAPGLEACRCRLVEWRAGS